MTAPDYGRAFGLWRADCADPWRAYTRHDFVEGLRDGSLPRAAFLHYLRQDYVFLFHFARAWALAAVKATRLEEMQAAAATVNALVHHEMQLHVDTCADAGITESDLRATAERPENMAYTRYVLEAGYSGDFLDLMAALAPCVLGYGEIGARLAETASSDRYSGWISVYSGDEYQQVCRDVGALIDDALMHRLGADFAQSPRWAPLCQRFGAATRLEVGFWDMGLTP
ncbi:thiaminase II [Actibacterium ureilyticum]|uniref:thiaminase II n=1 Tax=Actibacterium ureilyticum TaxID=1590614 RepID=UPI000BAAB960|nr:thiaminase II [Actibacterium ureilyticum]